MVGLERCEDGLDVLICLFAVRGRESSREKANTSTKMPCSNPASAICWLMKRVPFRYTFAHKGG